jgi:F-type H+-transporting ATPase subunit a
MRLVKIIFACGLLAVVLSLQVRPSATPVPAVQPAPNAAAVSAPQAGSEVVKPPVPEIAPTLFYLFGCTWLPVTNSMVCTWMVALVIFVVVRFSTWKVKEVPTGAQNVMETIIEGWEDLAAGVLEPKVVHWVFPLAATYFIFILTSNLMGLLPGMGSIGIGIPAKDSLLPFAIQHAETPFFRAPTSDANLTVAMAGIFLVMSFYWALRYNGLMGLVKHIFGVKGEANKWALAPLAMLFIFIGLMEMVSIILVRPLALAMRLYGNILGGESVLTLMLTQTPLGLGALPFYFLELFVAVVQALVFALLTIAFVGTMCAHAEEPAGGH